MRAQGRITDTVSILTSALEGDQCQSTAALPQEKSRNPLYKKLGGLRTRPKRVFWEDNISDLPEFEHSAAKNT